MEDQNNGLKYRGLNAAQVEENRRKFGANLLQPPEHEPWWTQLLHKFDDPVIRILIIAALIAIVTGEFIEGIGIIIAVLLATLLAFINEFRAEKEFDLLNKVNDDIPIKTVRDGKFQMVSRKELVVGDIIFVERGEEFPADGKVLEAVSFQVDQSKLTGESEPVVKVCTDSPELHNLEEGTYPADRTYRGTMVSDGYGYIELTAVGQNTEIGKTAAAGMEDIHEETPLTRQLEGLSKVIGVVGFGISGLTFGALIVNAVIHNQLSQNATQWGIFALLLTGIALALVRVWLPVLCDGIEIFVGKKTHPQWLERGGIMGWISVIAIGIAVIGAGLMCMKFAGALPPDINEFLNQQALHKFIVYFMIAVTLIVVAVPEGLAMSVTLSLAYSMRRMTASNSLVRKMHACETIGAATVICTDKTGTLTMNQMRVQEVHFPILKGQELKDAAATPEGKMVAEALAANSTANLSRNNPENPEPVGNPTEGALLLLLDKQGIDYEIARHSFKIKAQLTFSTERKFMATAGASAVDGRSLIYIKGAPEMIMSRCNRKLEADSIIELKDSDREQLFADMKKCQSRGMRTIAVAYGEIGELGKDLADDAVNLVWLGYTGIADPVRPDVPAAVKTCRDAGIEVKMVTGDNPETAMEIGRQIGLWNDNDTEGRIITGKDFGDLSDDEAYIAAQRIHIMARARPTDKLRLVKLLKKAKHVVAVTGDGTNDAPALNNSDVGIAMGMTGTSVAKEASAIILLDDSFNSIVNAVMWGRSLYQNIQKFIIFQLTINVAALSIAVLGPFIGVEMPLTVMQMLWINLIMDTFAALSLATEPPHHEVMNRPPRQSTAFIVNPAMRVNIFTSAAFCLAVFIGILMYIQKNDGGSGITDRELTWFFSIFAFIQVWNLFNAKCWGSSRSFFTRCADNPAFMVITLIIVAGQILIVQYGGSMFRTEALSSIDWICIIAGTSAIFWIGEAIRLFRRQKKNA